MKYIVVLFLLFRSVSYGQTDSARFDSRDSLPLIECLFSNQIVMNNYYYQSPCYSDFERFENEPFAIKKHKRTLDVWIYLDSFRSGSESIKFQETIKLKIKNETDLIALNDSIFFKIILIRNEEYGEKFYSWKWDFYKDEGDCYRQLLRQYYFTRINYITIPSFYSFGQGLGNYGAPDYLIVYYRYYIR